MKLRILLVLSMPLLGSPTPAGEAVDKRIDALIKNLDSTELETQLTAIDDLADWGPRAAKAAPALASLLTKGDDEVRLSAAVALGKIGKEAVAPVAKLLDGGDGDTRYYALAALGWIGPAANSTEPVVFKLLEDKNDSVRAKAAFALGHIGADPKKAVRPLLKLLIEKNEAVRGSAGAALGNFKEHAVPGLIEALQDDFMTMRLEAAKALGQIGPPAKSASDKLRTAAADPANEVAEEALTALVKIGPDALPSYRSVFEHERAEVRQRAFLVLEKMEGKAAPFLAAGLAAKNLDSRRDAARVLAAMGLKEEVLVAPLAQALKDKDQNVRRQSLQALVHVAVGAQRAVPAILEVLKEKDADMRIAALDLLRQIPGDSEAVVKVVTPFLRDDNEQIRRLATEVLAFQGRKGLEP